MAHKKNKPGYITITIVLVLLVVTLSITATLSFLSTGAVRTAEARQFGEAAFFNADACMEEGLLRIKKDPLYAGGEVTFPNGTCHIGVDNQNGSYTVQVYFSGADKYWRSLEADAAFVNGILTVTNWKEQPLVVN